VSDQSADGIWADVTARLREDLSETAFSAWFGSARPVSLEGSRLVVRPFGQRGTTLGSPLAWYDADADPLAWYHTEPEPVSVVPG
jgi:hypothetical protein